MENNIIFLTTAYALLHDAGIPVVVFGGWAEELQGVIDPRPHKDVDLLYESEDFAVVDAFLATCQAVKEILPKRFPHKRAFMFQGVMVELLLLQKEGERLITNFWNKYKFEWPIHYSASISSPDDTTVPLAVPAVLTLYRERFLEIDNIRQERIVSRPPEGSPLSARAI